MQCSISHTVQRATTSHLRLRFLHTQASIRSSGRLHIQLTDRVSGQLVIKALWQDHVDWSDGAATKQDYSHRAGRKDITGAAATVQVLEDSAENNVCRLQVTSGCTDAVFRVPEHVDLFIEGMNPSMTLLTQGKICGDVSVSGSGGRVVLDKLRGSHLTLDLPNGSAEVKRVLEFSKGTVTLQSLKAKMLLGEQLRASVTDLTAEAMYVDKSLVRQATSVSVWSLRGFLKVVDCIGDVSVRGVDGGVDCTSVNGKVALDILELKYRSQARSLSQSIDLSMHQRLPLAVGVTLPANGTADVHLPRSSTGAEESVSGQTSEFRLTQSQSDPTTQTQWQCFVHIPAAGPQQTLSQSGKINVQNFGPSASQAPEDRRWGPEEVDVQLEAAAGVTLRSVSWKDSVSDRIRATLSASP